VFYNTVSGDVAKVSSLTTFGAITATSITNTGLTSGRVVYSTTGGLETDSANFTFNGTTATINTLNLTNALGTSYGGTGLTSFTANGVVYASSTSALSTGGNLTYDGNLNLKAGAGERFYTTSNGNYGYIRNDGATTTNSLGFYANGRVFSIDDSYNAYFYNSSGSETARFTNAGYLGIGTSSPTAMLQANGSLFITGRTVPSSGVGPELYWNGTQSYLLSYDRTNSAYKPIVIDGSYQYFNINGSTALSIDGSGNLGLGVTPSAGTGWANNLEMLSTSNIVNQGTDFSVGTNWYYNSGYKYKTSAAVTNIYQKSGTIQFQYAASGTTGAALTFLESMRIDNSGNLGIGTTSPTSPLDISSSGQLILNINSTNTNGGYLGFKTSGTAIGYFGASQGLSSGTNTDLTVRAQNNLTFTSGGGTERMRLDSSGNLLVNQTSTGLQNSRSFTYQGVGDGSFYVNHSTVNTSGDSYIQFGYNATKIGSITQNGTTGVLYNLTSDYRLKNNPVPVTGAKEFIMGLQPKSWDWWDGSGKGVGFIAHEFMEIAKYSGHGEKDAVDAEGKPVYQSIQPSSSEVMANLVALVQELTNKVTALEAKLGV
jgi:hypothetical protein